MWAALKPLIASGRILSAWGTCSPDIASGGVFSKCWDRKPAIVSGGIFSICSGRSPRIASGWMCFMWLAFKLAKSSGGTFPKWPAFILDISGSLARRKEKPLGIITSLLQHLVRQHFCLSQTLAYHINNMSTIVLHLLGRPRINLQNTTGNSHAVSYQSYSKKGKCCSNSGPWNWVQAKLRVSFCWIRLEKEGCNDFLSRIIHLHETRQ